uniref:Uncharacterized protein n=1 Tax=Theileria parva TaxID=5875 RepID=Q4N145_THEPA|eukprot:XP_764541.1 hypothetical protein [Theileria parva strain Muguga]
MTIIAKKFSVGSFCPLDIPSLTINHSFMNLKRCKLWVFCCFRRPQLLQVANMIRPHDYGYTSTLGFRGTWNSALCTNNGDLFQYSSPFLSVLFRCKVSLLALGGYNFESLANVDNDIQLNNEPEEYRNEPNFNEKDLNNFLSFLFIMYHP